MISGDAKVTAVSGSSAAGIGSGEDGKGANDTIVIQTKATVTTILTGQVP